MTRPAFLEPHDTFVRRHVSPDSTEVEAMLETVGVESLDALVDETVPAGIRLARDLAIGPERGERELLVELKAIAQKNEVRRSYLGLGYYGTIVPPVIQRNVLENPGWYTQYTPYQAEISQGRLEALLNFQTVIADLCGLPVANASMLDEATAAAEAMALSVGAHRNKRTAFFASDRCHPQTLAVLRTRADAVGITLEVGDASAVDFSSNTFAGVLLQVPESDGALVDPRTIIERAREAKTLVVVATDLLALTLIASPGVLGADVAVGSAQRFGVPFGYGGPHAAFLATKDTYKRQMPGRIIGISKDRHGNPALRMALQTREQHIRRDKATSNICTAQVLLAIMASMYAVYHGPDGLVRIAERAHLSAVALAAAARRLGHEVVYEDFFDTVCLRVQDADAVLARASERGINLRRTDNSEIVVALDETVEATDLVDLFEVLGAEDGTGLLAEVGHVERRVPEAFSRSSSFLDHPVFHQHRSEHEMLRYLRRLEGRDLSLTTSMIPLGSCTMKLNGTSEMVPVTWPEFSNVHPFVPREQAAGYAELFTRLEQRLCEITGFHAVSLQPNAGSQGEYAGLLVIRALHESRKEAHRNICLIPVSAHGTNPASAVMAGMKVVAVACDEHGNIDLADLRAKAEQHKDNLAALMVTYPSTHGVFEEEIRAICDAVHENGGQVYMDGANMNAQVGLCRPGDFGADVCHLNLHKTFCIPHGGGGPGMGPIGVAEHLAPFLPGHPIIGTGGDQAVGAVAAAPWGSPSILTISWVYIELMGAAGLTHATRVAILNANYMAKRLEEHYPVLYRGARGRAAHEFIIDLRPFEKHVSAEDVAKRLMDYGFHAPTMSFPVSGTLMIEPTESETKAELDRLCDSLISIRAEIEAIEEGRVDASDNPLKMAPHTASEVAADEWSHPYSREEAAFPAAWVRSNKFWPSVGRVDNGFGDKNLICTCPSVEEFAATPAPEPSLA